MKLINNTSNDHPNLTNRLVLDCQPLFYFLLFFFSSSSSSSSFASCGFHYPLPQSTRRSFFPSLEPHQSTMPNKYSHALVLSHYQSRGLIKFPQSPPSPYVAPLPVESRLRVKPRSQTPATDGRAPMDQARSSTPPEPAVTVEPATTHQPTPSIITEIYAPERKASPNPRQSVSPDPSLTSLSIVNLDTELEDDVSCGHNSLTTSTSARSSSMIRSTPRSSVSTVAESPTLGPFEDLPPCPDLFPILEDCVATPWEELQATPAVFRLQSMDFRLQSLDSSRHRQPPAPSPPAPSSPTRSPSPDDAAPPPIARYRRVSFIPVPKSNRTSSSSTKLSRSGPVPTPSRISTSAMKLRRSSPHPETAPSAGHQVHSDRLHGHRSMLGDWIMGSRIQR